MENTKIKEYQAELSHSFGNIESMLSQLQISIGVIKTLLYLINKESKNELELKKEESK